MLRVYCLLLIGVCCFQRLLLAEFPALEKELSAPTQELAKQIDGKPVLVCARNLTGISTPWSLVSAVQLEAVSQLLKSRVDATDIGNDSILDKLMVKDDPFTSADLNFVRRSVESGLFLGIEIKRSGNSLQLGAKLFDIEKNTEVFAKDFNANSQSFALNANIPELNQKVLLFAQQNMNKKVGSGNGWSFVAEALKSVGAKRKGIYHFGRLLGPNEAWLPGDLLQFEEVEFRQYKGKRRTNMHHQSGIVFSIDDPEEIEIAIQSYNGSDVTTHKIRARELQQGRILAFRPSTGDNEHPEPIPLRKSTPEPVTRSDGTIDVLKTLDTNLDSIHGYWHQIEGPLRPVKENFSRLQIPVDLPENYTVELRVRQVSGSDVFGLGIVVGGHQSMIAIDSYSGKVLGLHRLDNKKANANETTTKTTIFKPNEWIDFKCVVVSDGLTLYADGKQILDWHGDPKRLSNDDKWAVPNSKWLFLATNDNVYEIGKMTITPN